MQLQGKQTIRVGINWVAGILRMGQAVLVADQQNLRRDVNLSSS